jgi:two-component system sensor histidine kinase MprB
VAPLPFDPDAISQALDQDGVIVASAGGQLPVTEADKVLASLSPSGAPLLRTIALEGENYRMITRHVRGGGAVQVARSLTEQEAVLDRLLTRSLVIGITLSLLAAAAGWWITRSATRPLRSLTLAAERIAKTKDLEPGVGHSGTDDVGRLASSFDEMLAALAESREQQHRLIQDAGHELRTPLTTLQANIGLLQRAPHLEGEPREALLKAISTELSELNLLFTELMELATDSRDESPLGLIDLNDPVERALDVFAVRSQREVEVVYNGSEVMGNVELLERAVSNLLSNAEKFSPPGEPLVVDVRGGSVAVSDRGPGIPADEQVRVFDRFWRSEEARSLPGSGLGLAIVKKIVQQHNGEVSVRSREGGGTTVGFALPEPGAT